MNKRESLYLLSQPFSPDECMIENVMRTARPMLLSSIQPVQHTAGVLSLEELQLVPNVLKLYPIPLILNVPRRP